MKRVLIVGISSMIGSTLAVLLRKKHRVFGTYNSIPVRLNEIPSWRMPLTSAAGLQNFVKFINPDEVFYCAGISDETYCASHQDEAYAINTTAAEVIASSLPKKSHFYYFSSSKVFSGDKGYYTPEELHSPVTTYGQTKALAETKLEPMENCTIFRLGNCWGVGAYRMHPGLNRIWNALISQKPLNLIQDEYRNFDSALAISEKVLDAMETKPSKRFIHLASEDTRMSYYDFGRRLGESFGLSTDVLKPVSGKTFSPQVRGKDLSLVPSTKIQSWEQQLNHFNLFLKNGMI